METTQTQTQTEAIVPQEAQNSGILAQVQAETQAFELVQRQAKMLASSTMVPKDFANNVPNCAIALNISKRTGIDVLMVTQNIDIIHGRPSWRATALIGMIRSCGSFTPLRFVFDDDDNPTKWRRRKGGVQKVDQNGSRCLDKCSAIVPLHSGAVLTPRTSALACTLPTRCETLPNHLAM
jgi:hypothetical protein